MIEFVGSNKCPLCGKEFLPTPPLRPNVSDREMYGGRIKFFKEVECDCASDYDLCIEEKYTRGENKLCVIDMIVLHRGIPEEELAKKTKETKELKEELLNTDPKVLATVLNNDSKKKALELLTMKEIYSMCKKLGIKTAIGMSKKEIIEKMLEVDPTLVVAHE